MTHNFIIIIHLDWKITGQNMKERYKTCNSFPVSYNVTSLLRGDVE
jgi:hypothetical protein